MLKKQKRSDDLGLKTARYMTKILEEVGQQISTSVVDKIISLILLSLCKWRRIVVRSEAVSEFQSWVVDVASTGDHDKSAQLKLYSKTFALLIEEIKH